MILVFRKYQLFLLVSFIGSMQAGCLSVTTLQSGRTLGKDNKELSAAATFGNYPDNSLLLNDQFYKIPVFTTGTTYGLSEKLDLSVKFNTATYLSSGLKYQFFGNRESLFAASFAGEGGFLPLMLLGGDLGYYLSFPLITSFHPHELIAIHMAPRYIYNKYEEGSGNESELLTRNHMGGISYGLSIGNKHKGILEFNHFYPKIGSPVQISIGYFYKIGF